ncbi:MAG: cyclic nucleotide-binding domain-containing protein, partial [Acidobacteriaceae bacterium]|nr:cyclic nucleotide-binding domain-containing protein [Acidobacteriaceae bacterium]
MPQRVVHRTVVEDAHPARPPLFSGISPTDYEAIRAAGRKRAFARGEVLHLKGDTVQQVSLVTSGFVKITQLGMAGAEV